MYLYCLYMSVVSSLGYSYMYYTHIYFNIILQLPLVCFFGFS
jgi:hypothetical protein